MTTAMERIQAAKEARALPLKEDWIEATTKLAAEIHQKRRIEFYEQLNAEIVTGGDTEIALIIEAIVRAMAETIPAIAAAPR